MSLVGWEFFKDSFMYFNVNKLRKYISNSECSNDLENEIKRLNKIIKNHPKWTKIEHKRPKVGQKVLLFANGVVQGEIYMFDKIYILDDYFVREVWYRDDCCKQAVRDDHYWMPLPKKP
jgi:hypothetical protein